MKRLGIYIIANITSIWIATILLTGFKVTGGFVAFVFLSAAISALNWLVKPIIRFFTLPINFGTVLLFGIVFNFAALYVFKAIIPGYGITSGDFLGIDASVFVIPSWHVDALFTVAIAGTVFALMTAFVDLLLEIPEGP